jgi:hypothetical protein
MLVKRLGTPFLLFLVLCTTTTANAAVVGSAPSSCGSLDSQNFSTHTRQQIENKVVGLNAASLPIFAQRGTGLGSTWIRNTGAWGAVGDSIDWTGQSPWNSVGGYDYSGTLISPRHIVMAAHYSVPNGATIAFVAEDGTVVERTVSSATTISGTDIRTGILNSAVPEEISFFPILPSATSTRSKTIPTTTSTYPDVPVIVFDKEDKAIVHKLAGITSGVPNAAGSETISHSNYSSSTNELLTPFSETLVGGDSGNPGFIVIDGTPVLALVHYGASIGPNIGAYASQIDTVMDSLSGSDEYDPVVYDIDCFETIGTNTTPAWQGSSYVSNVIEEVVGVFNPFTSVSAVDADGDTITYEIVSMLGIRYGDDYVYFDPADYFTIDSSTGLISSVVSGPNSLDYETLGDEFTIVVKATDDGSPTAESTTIAQTHYLIDGDETPAFESNSVALSIMAGAKLDDVVGVATATDPDIGAEVEYSIIGTSDFAIDADTGEIRVQNESAVDRAGDTSTFTVMASSSIVALYNNVYPSGLPTFATTSVTITTSVSSEVKSSGGGRGGRSKKTQESKSVQSTVNSAALQSAAGGTQSGIQTGTQQSNLVTISRSNRDLEFGSTGEDVRTLQKFLNEHGYIVSDSGAGSVGFETTYFGERTRVALARWQAARGIVPAVGYFGPKTRATLSSLMSVGQ